MKITQNVMDEIMYGITGYTNEIGGILGGANEVITNVIFDFQGKNNTNCKYIPNVSKLNEDIRVWYENNIEFYGMFHTHFYDERLSKYDREYISNIMNNMSNNIKKLYFPIVVLPKREVYIYKAEKQLDRKELLISRDKITILGGSSMREISKEKCTVTIPEGFFGRECCRNCKYGEDDPTANWKVYCNRKRTHVRPEDRCGYYE